MKKFGKISVVLFLLVYFFGYLENAMGQMLHQERVEINMEQFSDDYTVVSARDKGVLIFRETDIENNDNDPMWEFIMYDTTLNQKWKRSYFFEDDYELRGYDYKNNELLILYKNGPYEHDNLTIVDMELGNGDTTNHVVNRIVPLGLTQFERAGETVLFGGYANNKPVVLQYDLLTRKTRVLPGIYGIGSDLLDVIPYDNNKTFKVVMTRKNQDINNLSVVVMTFDQYGGMLQNAKFDPESDKDFMDAYPLQYNERTQTISGTYGMKGSKYSRGLFWATINPNGEKTVKYFNYGNLDRFFNYMRENREERVKRRIERRKEKGKKLRFNYRLAVHDFIERGGKYYFLGEAYYPKYRSNYYYGSFLSNFGNNHGYRDLVGYEFTHSILACFDENGEMLWDHSYAIDDVERERLRQVTYTVKKKDSIVFLNTNENKIKYKVVDDSGILTEKKSEEIKLSNENEEIRRISDEDELRLEKWYGGNFFLYGIQKIKQVNENGWNNYKEVFFINKVTVN